MECARCMSFESRGRPLTVCSPETTQLFEPGTHSSHLGGWNRASTEEVCVGTRSSSSSSLESFFGGVCSSIDGFACCAGGRSRHEVEGYKSAISCGFK